MVIRWSQARKTYHDVLQSHLSTPHARNLIQGLSALLILDHPTDGIIRSAKVAFCLEIDIRQEVVLRATDETVVAQLVLHLTKQDASCVHVWLRQKAFHMTPAR